MREILIEVIFLKNNNSKRQFSIRKFTIGVVSIVAGITFFVSEHDVQAAEQQSSHLSQESVLSHSKPSDQDANVSSKESEIDKNINKVDDAQSYSQQNEQQSSKAESKEIQNSTQAEQVEKQEQPASNQTANHSSKEPSINNQESHNKQQTSDDKTPNTEPEKIEKVDNHKRIQNQYQDKNKKVDNKQSNNSQLNQKEHPNSSNNKQQKQRLDVKPQKDNQQLQSRNDVKEKLDNQPIEQKDTKQQSNNKSKDNTTSVKSHSQQHKQHSLKTQSHSTPGQKVNTNISTKPTQQQTTNQNIKPKNTDEATIKSNQYKNKYPVVLVHGFLGLVGDNAPALYPNYWGGTKFPVKKRLEKLGYDVHEASVGAFSSNYDRAVELYHYIKGGKVDYGAAHAAKTGHDRYGKFYQGIMPDWEPGKKIHLIGHSMGGQTIRLLEHFLRHGNQEEIDYQKAHGGEISPLFTGGKDNMISSITTLATPHNGTPAADKLGNTDFVKGVFNRIGRLSGNKYSHIDLGFSQWGFKQRPDESYIDYVKRVANSKIWKTQDSAVYDLTTEGSEKLNQMTSINPNIVYTSYTGLDTHTGPLGNENPNIRQFFLFDLTSRLIGRDDNVNVRKNDGIVPVSSSLFPTNQAAKSVGMTSPTTDKGIWQVKPVMNGWDHLDFVGLDATDYKRIGEELSQFYLGIINNLIRIEDIDGIKH